MITSKSELRSCLRAIVIVALAILLVCSSGCNPLTLIGASSSINLYIPLGLGGEPGLLNMFQGTGQASSNGTTNNTTTDTIPPPVTGSSF